MRAVTDVLLVMVAAGGCGAFVDFVIGVRGQQRVRNWLEDCWLRVHADWDWHNFGQREAETYLHVADLCVGARLLSARRIGFVCGIVTVCVLVFTTQIRFALFAMNVSNVGTDLASQTICRENWVPPCVSVTVPSEAKLLWTVCTSGLPSLLLIATLAAFSLSFTRAVSSWTISLARNRTRTLGLFLALVVGQWGLLVMSLYLVHEPLSFVVQTMRNLVGREIETLDMSMIGYEIRAIYEHLSSGLNYPNDDLIGFLRAEIVSLMHPEQMAWNLLYAPDDTTSTMATFALAVVSTAVALFTNAFRIVFALSLVCSFILREWAGRAFSLLWDRVVSSEKPPFTLILSGIGGVGSSLLKLFS